MTSTVAAAAIGAAGSGTSDGTSVRRPNTTGSTVAGISMFTVPTMVGVRNRRNSDNRADMASGSRDETMTRTASRPGPPSTRAVTQIPMNAAAGPVVRTYPAPIRPSRDACNIVAMPLTATVQNTAHDRYASVSPAARITIVGKATSPVIPSTTSCTPHPRTTPPGGRSSGS